MRGQNDATTFPFGNGKCSWKDKWKGKCSCVVFSSHNIYSSLLQRIEHCSMRKSTCRLPIYLCMYVYVYVYVYVSVYVYVYEYIYVCMYVCIYTNECRGRVYNVRKMRLLNIPKMRLLNVRKMRLLNVHFTNI